MASWEAERRLDYIDFRMRVDGTIRRADLMRTFGVSLPQASKDINEFLRLYPGSLVYDKTEKAYVPRDGYVSLRGMTNTVIRLIQLLYRENHPTGWH